MSKIPDVKVPRTIEELNAAYSSLVSELGQAEYQVYAHSANASSLKKQILDVNVEANQRRKLDEEKAKDAALAAAATPAPTPAAPAQGAPNA